MAEVWTIINATPDSFYGGSRAAGDDDIRRRIETSIKEGASTVDIGAMSTRPGFDDISAHEEFERLRPALRVVREHFPAVNVSIDTFRSEVARRAVAEFGTFKTLTINDISGGQDDPMMMQTVGELGLGYVMMSRHDTIEHIEQFFEQQIAAAQKANITQIIIDPGFGFGKSLEQNFEVLANMERLKKFDLPVLIGISRKSMIFKTLEITPDEALNGTTALHFEALMRGADIIRAHDTIYAAQTIKLYETYTAYRG